MSPIPSAAYVVVVLTVLTACGRTDRTTDTASTAGAADTRTPGGSTTATATPAGAGNDSVGTTSASGAIRTASAAGVGRYLTDARGRAIYMFERDTKNTSTCTTADGCAIAWPPVPATPLTSTDSSVRAAMLGTINRSDNRKQTAYNGMPVYYYEDDKKPGDIEGQGKQEFGGLWYLVSPSGREIKASRQSRK
jgi:predicted lipoprotein with Yx(FWY)xxD motif